MKEEQEARGAGGHLGPGTLGDVLTAQVTGARPGGADTSQPWG